MRNQFVALLTLACLCAARAVAADPVMSVDRGCPTSAAPSSVLFGGPGGAAAVRDPQPRARPALWFGEAPRCPVRPLDFNDPPAGDAGGNQTAPPALAFQYSHAYEVRDKIHKVASFALLPLFVSEAYLGQKLLTNPTMSPGAKSAHQKIAVAIFGLFGVNTVTGVWNLVDGSKDPHRGVRPVIHAVLMLAADAGFVATTLTGPKSRTASQLAAFPSRANLHKTLAYASVSVATVGYVIMLFK